MNNYSRTLVLGDIHGNVKALNQCLERCRFDSNKDTLIQLGDVADRFPDTAKVVERLLEFKNLIAIRGNHDDWTNKWFSTGIADSSWLANGGQETIDSYDNEKVDLDKHKKFFSDVQVNYYTDANDRIFVHGGFTQPKGPEYDLIKTQCLWDRSLWNETIIGQKLSRQPHILSGFKEIYIGHTPTLNWHQEEPMNIFNVWNLDTGAGHSNGRLTIMDIDSKEFWQSDFVDTLYQS